jgi:hypothetical protein
MTDKRGEVYSKEWTKEVEKQKELEKNQRQFRAQPLKIDDPFVPMHSEKLPTEPIGFHLHSSERSEQRKAFDEDMKERERMNEELKRQREDQEKVICRYFFAPCDYSN